MYFVRKNADKGTCHKKDLAVRSARYCRFQINVVSSTQFTIFVFVGIPDYPFSFDNYHTSFSCNVFWSHLFRLSSSLDDAHINDRVHSDNYYFVFFFCMLVVPNRSMSCTTYRKFLSSCRSLFLVLNYRFWWIIGGLIPQHDNEVHNRRAPAVWNTFGKSSTNFDKIRSCYFFFNLPIQLRPNTFYCLHVV